MSRSVTDRVRFSPSDTREWNDFFRSTNVASFSQSPQWADIWTRYTNGAYQPEPWIAQLPSGKRVLFPISRQRYAAGTGNIMHAAPGGTYGSWLAGDGEELSRSEETVLIRNTAEQFGSLVMRLFPFYSDGSIRSLSGKEYPDKKLGYGSAAADASFPAEKEMAGLQIRPDRSHVLDCSEGFDVIRQSWMHGRGAMKRKIQKAEEAGVSIRRASGEKDLDTYYQLYLQTIRNWAPPPSHVYGREMFSILLADQFSGNGNVQSAADTFDPVFSNTGNNARRDKTGSNSGAEMWLADFEGDVVAGVIVLRGNRHTAYWHGCSGPEGRKLRAMNLLMARLIARSCETGDMWFDFNPSQNISGVEQFKKSFGAVAADSRVLEKTSGLTRLLAYPAIGGLASIMKRAVRRLTFRPRRSG